MNFFSSRVSQLRMYFNSSQSDIYARGDVEFSFSQGTIYIYNQIQLFGTLHTKETLYLSPISGRLPNLGVSNNERQ